MVPEGQMRTRYMLLVLMIMAVAAPAAAQVDIAGEWGRDNHEDQPHRAPGAENGDYTGIPLNDAGRLKSDTWNASVLSQPEQQAKPHPAQYSMRGPGPQVRISKIVHPVTAQLIAYTLEGFFGRADRLIYMDGRPHPSEYAEHTFAGFSTGEWDGNPLKVTTTHMKTAFVNRNGPPSSYRGVMIEYFIPRGEVMSHVTIVDDPVYLEEPMVRTNEFSRRPGQHVGPAIPFETVDELGDIETGWVPSFPMGFRHTEFSNRFDIPWEATRGYREALYPEYMQKIDELRLAEMAAGGR
jgi:hypothetical protein